MDKKVDILIVGGGPAGLAAAVSAKEKGIDDLLIIERDVELGGILNQCIHNGFGLHTFKEELTGPEYAFRYEEKIKELGIPCLLRTIVVDISVSKTKMPYPSKMVTAMNKEEGLFTIEAKTVILAMGCRERSRGALNIPGYRPAGIYSAGTAQRYVNIEGRMPGREAVILGSGDIGLIMARRLTLEGAKVKLVAEIMPYSGGLKRNIVQCLDDYGIPLKLSHTVIDIDGRERVKGVTVAQVDADRRPIPGTEEYIACDTLLLSCGLIPENELSEGLGVELNSVTSGPVVNESLQTNIEGVFACGNVLHVHDLVDYVSEEAAAAGENAAAYLKTLKQSGQTKEGTAKTKIAAKMETEEGITIEICGEGGVRYTVPSVIRSDYMKEEQTVRFRVGNVYKDVFLSVYLDENRISRQKKKIMAPGEMEQIRIKKSDLLKFQGSKKMIIMIEQDI